MPESPDPDPHSLSEADWRARLTPEQYRVLRQAGTDQPFSAAYARFQTEGVGHYECTGCGARLFTSLTKFESHCGWPSFYDPADHTAVKTKRDLSGGRIRIEVVCARCDGHLGHVFEGEGFATPTDERYCINATALRFVPAAD
jgi:peptide-methionine (R)-S-oxide reductase